MNDNTNPEPTATLVEYPYDAVCPNPYQHPSERRFRGPDFDELVESIRVSDVRQPPPARPHPTIPGAVQLQMGHRRFAAKQIARPGELFAVLLQPLSEIQMFEGCVEENLHREGLNDIERAQLMEEYKTILPAATNADIARVFRLKDPASVTNLRKLLRLPAELQKHVAANALPDAYARALVGIAAVNAKAAIAIGNKVAAASKSDKADVFEEETRMLVGRMAGLNAGWSDDWLADNPVIVETDLGDGDHVVGACAGCVFHVRGSCARPVCYEEKLKMWVGLEATRVSASLKIPVAGADEKTAVLFKGEYHDDDEAKLLLNARKEIRTTLRLAPADSERHNYLRHVLGSKHLTLVTVDKGAVQAFLNERRGGSSNGKTPKADKPAEETDAQRAKRVADEKKEQAANRARRSTVWKSYYDALWLLESAARQIGAHLSVSDGFICFVEQEMCSGHGARGAAQQIEDRIRAEIKAAVNAKDSKAANQLRMVHVALNVIADNSHSRGSGDKKDYDFESVQEAVLDTTDSTQDEGFGVTLPKGWDIPPVHQTAINCWQCGTFAGNTSEKLTQRDLNEDGWIDDGANGVFCSSEHKAMYVAAQGKANATKPTKGKAAKSPAKTKAKTPKRRRQ